MTDTTRDPHFEQILQYLQQTRGFDFTAYKRTSLMRRVSRQMQSVGVQGYEAYFDYLQVHPEEFPALFNTILINVTSFYRDPEVWEAISQEILPALIAERGPGQAIRVWSAGCSSGQEPFTIAMILAELLGPDGRDRFKIYATDVDEEALAHARLAAYDARQVTNIPAPLLEKYFDRAGARYTFNRDLRRSIIFGRHDLVQDTPISRIDLLLCRNTLMYFNVDTQARILSRFCFSLNTGGCLALGRAEMLFGHSALFMPVNLKRRLFRALPYPRQRNRTGIAQTGQEFMGNQALFDVRLQEAAFESDAVPHIVLDASGRLAAVNAPARDRCGVAAELIGRPFQELEISYRPVDLRASVEQALRDGRIITQKNVRWSNERDSRQFDITITPLQDGDEKPIGIRISFHDLSAYYTLQAALEHSKQELETAYEELQSTNEELETTNEELQSTVEELETTNEELQSTNEELETMNEELHSTNEELQTMNDELRTRGTELDATNLFLESVLASLRSAVVVIDKEYKVLVWNERASELWGLRPEEAQGSHLLGLDIGLPLGELRQPIKQVLNDGAHQQELTLPAINRRGKSINCRISLAPLWDQGRAAAGVILLMEERRE